MWERPRDFPMNMRGGDVPPHGPSGRGEGDVVYQVARRKAPFHHARWA